MKNSKGFTLIELMIAVVIVAILLSLAVSNYSEYVDRARRADAKNALLGLQLGQVKWRSNHTTYSSTVTDVYPSTTSGDGYYTIAISASSSTAFAATAAPKAGTVQAGDSCGTYTITQAGPDISTAAKETCWDK